MDWHFSIGWFFAGLAILIGGAMIVIYYKWIADNFAHGINSYNKVKLAGIIIALVGLLVMANLHTALLNLLVKIIFKV